MSWLFYFFTAFIVSLAWGGVLAWINGQKENKKIVRLGGVGIIAAFLGAVFFNPEIVITSQILALLLGSFFILLIGVADDLLDFRWWQLLTFQIFLALVLVVGGIAVNYIAGLGGEMIRLDLWQWGGYSIWGTIFIIGWTIAVVNAVGWSDGIDGFSGMIALLGGGALFLVSLTREVNQPAVAILAIIFIGSILGVWLFNLPKAKIEAGTSGSYFTGYFLAVMAILAGTKLATTMIVLAVPLVDFVWVIIERWRAGQKITQKDERHLHYKLRRLGWSDGKIVLIYTIFIFVLLLLTAIIDSREFKLTLLLFESIVIVLFIWRASKKS